MANASTGAFELGDVVAAGKLLGSAVAIEPPAVVSLACLATTSALFCHGNVELLRQVMRRCEAELRRVLFAYRKQVNLLDAIRAVHPTFDGCLSYREDSALLVRAIPGPLMDFTTDCVCTDALRTMLRQDLYTRRIKQLFLE